jgi:hypothetical protein
MPNRRSTFAPQPHDDVNARDLVALGRSWRAAVNNIGIRNLEQLVIALDEKVMMG